MDYSSIHQPVMQEEVLQAFDNKKLDNFLDGTLGLGGHALALLQAHPELKTYYACDKDLEVRGLVEERLAEYEKKLCFQHMSFLDMLTYLKENNLENSLDGVLVDLGVSSYQLDQAHRGFSFRKEGDLDMRMDQSQGITAYEVVNKWSEKQIDSIIWKWGQDRKSRVIAKAIVDYRQKKKIETSLELGDIIENAVPRSGKMHPATRAFQAIRIAVNQELEELQDFLKQIFTFLKPGGRLVAISFHSLEDGIVKQAFKEASGKSFIDEFGVFRKSENRLAHIISKKPMVPSKQELRANSRSRSAKLRVIEKI
jgi:16S rRNA (cytosine1402-N4)-methyltransferase